jgi:hypothetical protein
VGGSFDHASALLCAHWLALSDPAAEDALHDAAERRDGTMILSFRHLLEVHDLCGEMLNPVSLYLANRVIRITTGTIKDYRARYQLVIVGAASDDHRWLHKLWLRSAWCATQPARWPVGVTEELLTGLRLTGLRLTGLRQLGDQPVPLETPTIRRDERTCLFRARRAPAARLVFLQLATSVSKRCAAAKSK